VLAASHWETRDGQALGDAIDQGYIVARGHDSRAAASWRGWCRDGRCPCVIVHRPGRFASVELDLAPAGWRLTGAGMLRIARLLTRWRLAAAQSTTALRSASLPPRRAEDFAVALLRILADPTSTEDA
jgi:hypothetical protein